MKIERKETEFQPVIITIETQEELDQLFAMAKYCTFTFLESSDGDISYNLFNELANKVVKVYSSESPAIFN